MDNVRFFSRDLSQNKKGVLRAELELEILVCRRYSFLEICVGMTDHKEKSFSVALHKVFLMALIAQHTRFVTLLRVRTL